MSDSIWRTQQPNAYQENVNHFVWCKTEGLPTNFAPNFIFLTS
jgi:hypothetical protein